MSREKLYLDWHWSERGFWSVRNQLEPLHLVVKPYSDGMFWQWDLCILDEEGMERPQYAVQNGGFSNAADAQHAAEQYFAKMVKKWPGIKID